MSPRRAPDPTRLNGLSQWLVIGGILVFIVLALFLVGCAPDRSDARAVSESTFRAILAKDYQQLRQLVGPGGNIPDEQAWRDASFLRDATPGERVKEQWVKGSISGYTLTESSFQDWQGLAYRPEKLAQVHFVLAGKSYMAAFPIADVGGKWSPGSNPGSSDFFIRFEEP